MGLITSRQNVGHEESDTTSNQIYKYPSKSGNYFANYFIIGGEKFDTPQPEAYLFGDNMDLNFLDNRPVPFPYPVRQTNTPIRPLKCLVNIRKESLRFVRSRSSMKNCFNIEFTFDCDVRCSITIHYFCTEEVTSSGIIYHPNDEKLTSAVYYYKKGANQQFIQPDHIFNPSLFPFAKLSYDVDKDIIPVAIHCVALEGPDDARQSHTTIAVIEHHDDTFSLKGLKQKLFVDGLYYLLQEIYGIENKLRDNKEINEDEIEDGGLECVICMCDMRDTLILPCRHLCLCQACADSLRYQANNCPICRSPFRALLQIKALRKYSGPSTTATESGDSIPFGFEHVSLVESLNGAAVVSRRCSERLTKSLRRKNNLGIGKDLDGEESENKDEVAPIVRGKLACHDTEDEDKSSSITDHLLHDKSVLCSPSTIHHVNEISNTEDEMPDEDSEAEKLSPLLEVGISYDENDTSGIEISVTDPKNEVCKSCPNNLSSGSRSLKSPDKNEDISEEHYDKIEVPITCFAEDFTCGSSEGHTNTNLNSNFLNTDKGLTSQPSTPASIASIRSSEDSYSSSGSSRRLLSSHEKPSLVCSCDRELGFLK